MKASHLLLSAAVALGALLCAGNAVTKGRSGKVAGWSMSSAGNGLPGASGSRSAGGANLKGVAMQMPAGAESQAMGMSGMLMTPNGMIVRNTPPLSVVHSTSVGGASMVTALAPGTGNSQLVPAHRGIGNSQGSGGTLDIAAMTHLGVSGVSAVSALLGMNGTSISSMLSSSAAGLAKPPSMLSKTSAGGQFTPSLMGMPVSKGCVSGAGSRSSCN